MHELERIRQAVQAILARGGRGLVVTVVGTRGSTYRRAGARAVLDEDAVVCGAISGGCVERDIAARLRDWLSGPPRVITYDATRADDIVFGMGLGCRGTTELLLQPFSPDSPPRLPELPGIFATVIASQNPRYAVGGSIDLNEKFDRTCRIDFDACDVLVEVIPPQHSVVVFGSGVDAACVADLARAAGWLATLVTSRDVHPDDVGEKLDLGSFDAAAVMTHNFLYDCSIVRALLASPVAYLGILGPLVRGEEILDALAASAADRARVRHPMGLDLGAETPEEIALSIAAEMQMVFARRSGKPLTEVAGPIHEPPAALACVSK